MYNIFISYRTTHSEWVEILAHNLKAQKYKVFLDRWELIPGEDFPAKIHQALMASRCAILVATPDSSDSGWVQQEFQTMISRKNKGGGFFFIPVVMGRFPDLPFLENVQAVDFGDAGPDGYRRAFRRLLCGLRQEPPGPDAPFKGLLQLPAPTAPSPLTLADGEKSFLEELFRLLDEGRPVMILAQADTDTQIYCEALRHKAQTLFGAENVFHIFPPNSEQADSAAYFGRLARQCGLDASIGASWQWADGLADKLAAGKPCLLLVTGFENGPDKLRQSLAGELRQLGERFYPNFHLLMMGSQRLAGLKYAHGTLSLLNIADETIIPDPAAADLREIFGRLYPRLQLSDQALREVLALTGGHPRLLHFCLQKEADSANACRALLGRSPLPAQLFSPFRAPEYQPALCACLKKTTLGKFEPWPADEMLRKLFWCNLLACRDGRFQWRCDYIRQVGLELLACG